MASRFRFNERGNHVRRPRKQDQTKVINRNKTEQNKKKKRKKEKYELVNLQNFTLLTNVRAEYSNVHVFFRNFIIVDTNKREISRLRFTDKYKWS